MALFSRRPKGTPDQAASPDAPPSDDAAATESPTAGLAAQGEASPSGALGDESASADEAPEVAASVDISMTSFQGLGAQAPAARAAAASEAPPATETVPGLPDNVLVRDALAALSDPPTPPQLVNVARQLLQGHLFLRVKGDARELLAAGRELPIATATVGDQSFLLAYSGGAALQASILADGDTNTSVMGQPVLTVIRNLLAGPHQGLVLDQASTSARAVLSRDLLARLVDEIDEELTLKTLLAEPRTAATAAAVGQALTRVPFWVAVGGADGERPGIAEVRTDDGDRLLELYSHPIEVAAMGRSDRPAPLAAAQLAGALRSDEGLTGVVINPLGPWIALTRADLAPLLALAS